MIQYKRKKSRKSFFLTTGLLVLLIFFSNRNPSTALLPSRALNFVVTPIHRVFYAASSGVQAAYDGLFGSKATQERVQQLEQENTALRDRLRTLETVVQEKTFLQDEYDLLQQEPDRWIPATILAKDDTPAYVRFTINAGSSAGVQVGDAVVEGVKTAEGASVAGLVGRVTEVGPNYAKVSSILDESSNVSILGTKTGDYGIINTRDDENLYGYTMLDTAQLAVGDEVVTSGLGGAYPRGLYVGRVTDLRLADDELTKRLTIDSPVDFFRLYRVLVLRGEANHE